MGLCSASRFGMLPFSVPCRGLFCFRVSKTSTYWVLRSFGFKWLLSMPCHPTSGFCNFVVDPLLALAVRVPVDLEDQPLVLGCWHFSVNLTTSTLNRRGEIRHTPRKPFTPLAAISKKCSPRSAAQKACDSYRKDDIRKQGLCQS